MFPEGLGREIGIFSAARVEKFMMSFAGEVQVAGENQMQAGVAVAIVVERFEEREHHGAIGGCVKRGMERPIPLAPGFHVGVVCERFLEMLQNFLGGLKIFFCEVGDGLAEDVALQDGARFEQLHDFVGRESGNHSAAIGNDGNQAFSGQVAEGFAHGDPANLKFGGDRVLTELFAFAEFAVENFVAEALDDGGG